jgi:hypothetical protein
MLVLPIELPVRDQSICVRSDSPLPCRAAETRPRDAIYFLDAVRRTVQRLVFMLLVLPWFQVGRLVGWGLGIRKHLTPSSY